MKQTMTNNNADKLVMNLSTKSLTTIEKNVLSYGCNYNIADARPLDFIADLECIISQIEATDEAKHSIRQQVSSMISKHRPIKTLTKVEENTLKKLRKDNDITIIPADKGRTTVVMDRSDYIQKALYLLNDNQSYILSEESNFKSLISKINKTMTKLKSLKAITQDEWRVAKPQDAPMPRFYGLPKIHKQNVPLRPIVSIKGTPLEGPSKWLFKKLDRILQPSPYTIKSPEQFLEKIKDVVIDPHEIMVSFDVKSLFTSIPRILATQTVLDVLYSNYDDRNAKLKTQHIMEVLDYCLRTFFLFNGKVYEQTKGTPMGSPISCIIAEAVLSRLEIEAFSRYRPKLWLRYVDDTFVIIDKNMLDPFYEIINSIYLDIQFTMEMEESNLLPFLDVLVERKIDGNFQTSVYRKATDTMQILNFRSNHPTAHKRSCVKTLFKRIETHCSSVDAKKNENAYLYELFIANGYPKSFVKNCLRNKSHIESVETTNIQRRSLPYISNVSHATDRLLRPYGIHVAHRPNSTMRQNVMHIKDNLRDEEKSNVIYDIECNNCQHHYVGETSKKLKTRVHEHELCVKRRDHLSLVAQHSYENTHTFDFNKAKILDTAKTKIARQLKESWFSDENSINRHINLQPAYQALRHEISKFENKNKGKQEKINEVEIKSGIANQENNILHFNKYLQESQSKNELIHPGIATNNEITVLNNWCADEVNLIAPAIEPAEIENRIIARTTTISPNSVRDLTSAHEISQPNITQRHGNNKSSNYAHEENWNDQPN